ncbi:MAG: rhodanese-like domain-containing protein, partial [Bacteroidota bacterium]|nr:rhodanese-like domain-containing protein [Bacteroidota bacterium]
SITEVLEKALTPLTPAQVKAHLQNDGILVDTRNADQFTHGFVPESIFIGLDGRFAEWAGSLLPFDKPIALVTETGKEKETATRLARVGFSKLAGYLDGGLEAWQAAGEPIDMIIDVEADELAMDLPFDPNLVVLDVRRPAEYADGHVKDAVNIPLNDMTDPANMSSLEEEQNVYVHCAGGYRSVIAASLLKRQGIHNLRNVVGGWSKIKEEPKIPIEKEKSVLN